jgi:hypothetical protein
MPELRPHRIACFLYGPAASTGCTNSGLGTYGLKDRERPQHWVWRTRDQSRREAETHTCPNSFLPLYPSTSTEPKVCHRPQPCHPACPGVPWDRRGHGFPGQEIRGSVGEGPAVSLGPHANLDKRPTSHRDLRRDQPPYKLQHRSAEETHLRFSALCASIQAAASDCQRPRAAVRCSFQHQAPLYLFHRARFCRAGLL